MATQIEWDGGLVFDKMSGNGAAMHADCQGLVQCWVKAWLYCGAGVITLLGNTTHLSSHEDTLFWSETKTLVCTLCKVSMKCHSSTSAIQEHVKKCTILDDPEKKINPYWSILSNQQLVIISRYLIEEEEDEELVAVLFLAGILDLVLVLVFLTKCFLVLVPF